MIKTTIMTSKATEHPDETVPADVDEAPESLLFSGLNDEQWQMLFERASRQSYDKNTLIYSRGDSSTAIYYLQHGRVKIYDLTFDGREIIYRVCGPKTWFGVSSVFGGEERPVFAETQTPAKVMVIERDKFETFIHENPNFSVSVINLLGLRLRQAHAAITEFVVGDVRSRIAQVLIKFAEANGKASGVTKDGVVTLEGSFTHQEIANMIGSTRSTVTKVMNDWKRQGMIDAHSGRLEIHNYEALMQLIRH